MFIEDKNLKDPEQKPPALYGAGDSDMSVSVYRSRANKLVTALYMVTDCMDTDDALKGKLRLLGVEILSDTYKLPTLSPTEKSTHISVSLERIHELLSFVNIACTIGYISEMNSAILYREFNTLLAELQSYQKDTHFAFTLNNAMFTVEKPVTKDFPIQEPIKDKHQDIGHIIKRTYAQQTQTSRITSPLSLIKGLNKNSFSIIDKEERSQKIVSLIKDKKDMVGNQGGLSIKDISIAFTDCSEKTIQRELNSLVSKGAIKKTGSKRWSRYQTV